MELQGRVRIAAPRAAVWQALNDTTVLARCIPGCEAMERQDDGTLTAKVALKIGPLSARFSGKVTLSDIVPAVGYTLTGEGNGGAAGFGKGTARVTLSDVGSTAAELAYTVEAQVGGKLAQLGARLIDGVAAKLADDFFARFAEEMAQTAVPDAGPSVRTVSPKSCCIGEVPWLALAVLAALGLFFALH